MHIKILGCGPSYGVPSLTRGFGDCDPTNPKNFRLRSSVLVQEKGINILIDSGPEVRIQLLRAGHPKLDAVFYTHEHYDHMGGADDLRVDVSEKTGNLPVYLSESALEHFKSMLDYLFLPGTDNKSIFDVHIIKPYQPIQIGDLEILPIPQKHGEGISIGYRIGDFAYSTDVVAMDDRAFQALAGVKVWVLGVVTPIKNSKHINVDTALQWIKRVNPKQTYFTHMGARMDYDTLCRTLPDNIRPVYDGMEFDV